MYLRRVTIKNVRCFGEKVCFDFSAPMQSQPSWTLILGDNGTGKTTLLRSIAMGLCDETSASGLLSELDGEFIRHEESTAEITVELQGTGPQDESLTITTTINRTSNGAEKVEQTATPPDSSLRARVFACGYGARRAVLGSAQYDRYRLINSLLTLFDYEASLLNPEVYLYRLEKMGVETEPLLRKLDKVLLLPEGSVKLDASGFAIQGPWGRFEPVGAIPDGYASTLSWLCDLFGWSALFEGAAFTGDFQGIVLLDELEQHLHPSWQRQLIDQLARGFPRIQFVATTHSPLIAIGSASLEDQACQLALLEQRGGAVSARTGLTPPRDSRADQVLTSHLFGLASTTSNEVARKVARYSQLSGQVELKTHERVERDSLQQDLDLVFSGSESALQSVVREAVNKALEGLVQDGAPAGDPAVTARVLDFEVRRQLMELLGWPEDVT